MKNADYIGILDSDINIRRLTVTMYQGKRLQRQYKRKKGEMNYSRFFLVLNGTTHFTFKTAKGKKTVSAGKNDIIYLPNDIEYESHWSNTSEIEHISIHCSLFNEQADPLVLSDEIFVMMNDNKGLLRNSFKNIYKTFISGEIGYKIKCYSLFYDIFRIICIEQSKIQYKMQHNDIYKAIMFIENNYLEKIDVSSLAKSCNMCDSTFRYKFKSNLGFTPIEYRNLLRIKKAADLIRYNNYTVSEAAYSVNIFDLPYFNRLFKKYFNVPPSKY